jgi:hypothetical protein
MTEESTAGWPRRNIREAKGALPDQVGTRKSQRYRGNEEKRESGPTWRNTWFGPHRAVRVREVGFWLDEVGKHGEFCFGSVRT